VPALIALVAELPTEQSLQLEVDYLHRLAGAAEPTNSLNGLKARQQRSAVWAAWWERHKDNVVMADAFPRRRDRTDSLNDFRNHTLLVQKDAVTEMDATGKVLWTLTGLSQPQDVQVLPSGRVLLAEKGRVTERSLDGGIVWQHELRAGIARELDVMNVQRLNNGHTFIACSGRLIEVDRSGKEIMNVVWSGSNGAPRGAARRLPDGKIVAFDGGNVIQLDAKGKKLKDVAVRCGGFGYNEVLDNGHVLVESPGAGCISEFDADGKEVGRFDYPGANYGFRLPNGHTLVTRENGHEFIELDEKWQEVKKTPLPTPALKVKRR
jgi:outer membrane protein assembly factor BamB